MSAVVENWPRSSAKKFEEGIVTAKCPRPLKPAVHTKREILHEVSSEAVNFQPFVVLFFSHIYISSLSKHKLREKTELHLSKCSRRFIFFLRTSCQPFTSRFTLYQEQ